MQQILQIRKRILIHNILHILHFRSAFCGGVAAAVPISLLSLTVKSRTEMFNMLQMLLLLQLQLVDFYTFTTFDGWSLRCVG
jgi:hypothetical protein